MPQLLASRPRESLVILFVALVACNNATPASDTDAATPMDDAGGSAIDAAPDLDSGPMTIPSYRPCLAALECGYPNAYCDRSFPGGICSLNCTVDADCNGTGICFYGRCYRGCVGGADDCADIGGACYVSDTGVGNFCSSSCYVDAARPAGWPTCTDGQVCNPWGIYCADVVHDPVPPPGLENGQPCTAGTQCRSQTCFTEAEAPGWIGGACISFGREVADADFVPGGPLPQSNCPDGSVIYPSAWEFRNHTLGDLGHCFQSCTADSDCRPGYECSGLQDEGDGMVFTVGACASTDDCTTPAHACPTGYTCTPMGSASVCRPS